MNYYVFCPSDFYLEHKAQVEVLFAASKVEGSKNSRVGDVVEHVSGPEETSSNYGVISRIILKRPASYFTHVRMGK